MMWIVLIFIPLISFFYSRGKKAKVKTLLKKRNSFIVSTEIEAALLN